MRDESSGRAQIFIVEKCNLNFSVKKINGIIKSRINKEELNQETLF